MEAARRGGLQQITHCSEQPEGHAQLMSRSRSDSHSLIERPHAHTPTSQFASTDVESVHLSPICSGHCILLWQIVI
ncbi:hypothetical protein J6590_028037 [Homalodisca vitripennis]|nr:hypothetical protein J6590_028037 [Homalodisca vitripennis]